MTFSNNTFFQKVSCFHSNFNVFCLFVCLLVFHLDPIENKSSWFQVTAWHRAGYKLHKLMITSLIARFMGPSRGPSGADRTQVGPMLAPWTLLSGLVHWLCVTGYHVFSQRHIWRIKYTQHIYHIDKDVTYALCMYMNSSPGKEKSPLYLTCWYYDWLYDDDDDDDDDEDGLLTLWQ